MLLINLLHIVIRGVYLQMVLVRKKHWFTVLLAMILAIGPILPSMANAEIIHGLAAKVEDEQGKPLTNGTVTLFEEYSYGWVSDNVAENAIYPTQMQTYHKRLESTGEFFIPRAYLLEGKRYGIVVQGVSAQGKKVYYHYSFLGGQYDQLSFSHKKLKRLVLSDELDPQYTGISIYPVDGSGAIGFPYTYDLLNGAYVYTNSQLDVRGSSFNKERQSGYLVNKLIDLKQDGPIIEIDFFENLVKLTLSETDSRTKTLLSNGYAVKELYVTKQSSASVEIGYQGETFKYVVASPPRFFDRDEQLNVRIGSFIGTAYGWGQDGTGLQSYIRTTYSDEYGNGLVWAMRDSGSVFSQELQNREQTFYAMTTESEFPVALRAVTGPLGVTYEPASVPDIPVEYRLLDYDLLSQNGQSMMALSASNFYSVQANILPSGTYTLKKKKQYFPESELLVSMDSKFTVVAMPDPPHEGLGLKVQLPKGYQFQGSSLDNSMRSAIVWEISPEGQVLRGLGISYFSSDSLLRLYGNIYPDNKYLVQLSLYLREIDSGNYEPTLYYNEVELSGEHLLNQKTIPAASNLKKVEFAPPKGIPDTIYGLYGIDIQSSNLNLPEQTLAHYGPYLLPQGTYRVQYRGSDDGNTVYLLADRVSLGDQTGKISLDFTEQFTKLVPVQVMDGDKPVSFHGFNIHRGSSYSQSYYFDPNSQGQVYKLMTMPEDKVRFSFAQVSKEENETPWLHTYSTGMLNITSGLNLSFSGGLSNPDIQITQYLNNQEKTSILVDARIRKGDLFLENASVYRESGVAYGIFSDTTAVIKPKEYQGYFGQTSFIDATSKITDSLGRVVYRGPHQTFTSMYMDAQLEPGDYTVSLQVPVGPGKEAVASKAFTVLPVSTTPSKPKASLSQTARGLQVNWDKGTGTVRYEVFAAEKGKPLQKVSGDLPSSTTQFTLTGIQSGKTYQTQVVAVGRTGERVTSDLMEYEVPVFGVTAIDAQLPLSSAGLLKINQKLLIEMSGTVDDGITGKAEVVYLANSSEKTDIVELKLDTNKKYSGSYTIPSGITQIKSIKGIIQKVDGEKSDKTLSVGKLVGATLSGVATQNGEKAANASLSIGVVGTVTDKDGKFIIEGAPASYKLSGSYGGEYVSDLLPGYISKLGELIADKSVEFPVFKEIKLKFVEQDTGATIANGLFVSIRGNAGNPYSRDGYIDGNGLFTAYGNNGEALLKKVRTGSYTVSVKGGGIYRDTTKQVTVAATGDYANNPIQIEVPKRKKQLTDLTIKFLIPDESEVDVVESYSLYSYQVGQAFGWDAASHYGYQQSLAVTEQVYGSGISLTNASYTPGSVIADVYYKVAEIKLPNVVLSDDYYFYTQVKNNRAIYPSEIELTGTNNQVIVVVDPGAKLSGKVQTTDKRLLANASVYAYAGSSYAQTTTDGEGNFTLSGLSKDDDIVLHINHADYVPHQSVISKGTGLVSVVLQPSLYIEGYVLGQGGKPVLHAYVNAYSKQSYGGSTRTDNTGYFKIRGLAEGTYDLNVSAQGYPSVVQKHPSGPDPVTIVVGEQTGAFKGEGNSLTASAQTVVAGKTVEYRLDYKNNSAQKQDNVEINMTLADGLTFVPSTALWNGKEVTAAGRTLKVPIGSVDAGQSGALTFQVQLSGTADGVLVSNAKIGDSELLVTTNVLFVSLNAPAQTAIKTIKVYGNAKPGTNVEILIGGAGVAQVKADQRWWFAEVVLPVTDPNAATEYSLVAKVTDPQTGMTHTSQPATVTYNPKIPQMTDVTFTAGWNGDVKLNPYTGVATFAVVERTPMDATIVFGDTVGSATLSFLGENYALTSKDDKTFTGGIPAGWSSYGEQLLEVTFITKDNSKVTIPLMEVIVLIDPSGYVFEGSMSNRLEGVTAVVEEQRNSVWTPWEAEKFGQVNPQVTDSEGRYGWDVIQGNWRVLFNKEGYQDYVSRIVVVPPAETQLNVPLVRETTPTVVSIAPANGAEKVAVGTEIRIVFDRPMKEDNLEQQIKLLAGGQEVAVDLIKQGMKGYKEDTSIGGGPLEDSNGQTGWFIEDPDKLLSKEIVLRPKTALANGTTYQVVIAANVEDYDGKLLGQQVEAAFATEARTTTPAPIGGGGGGPLSSNDEVQIGSFEISNAVQGNAVILTMPEGKMKYAISSDAWKEVQSKGYPVHIVKDGSKIIISADAISLSFGESLRFTVVPAEAAKLAGYTSAGATVAVVLEKIKMNGQSEPIIASEPIVLQLKTGAVRNPSLIGVYEIVDGLPVYMGRNLTAEIEGSGIFSLMVYSKPFQDIQSHWAKNDIEYLISHHIVDGVTDSTFEPGQQTTRVQVAKLLVELTGLGADQAHSSFQDVDADAWYAKYVAAAEKAGIFQGADGRFRPDDSISREELAVVLIRLLELGDEATMPSGNAFSDHASISAWASESVAAAVRLGLIQGDESNRFNPQAEATRAESAAMIHRLIRVIDGIE
jgi:uncharacterized repeat protein (TIGR01451 family)